MKQQAKLSYGELNIEKDIIRLLANIAEELVKPTSQQT